MFIKLTRFDNRPVWLNASFIVTVEPRKDGVGSVIVPIGDGFDYDVRESVEEILEKLEGAPAPAIVPVPAPDCLTKRPADISPAPEPEEKPIEVKKPRRRTVRKTKTEQPAEPPVEKPLPPLELSEDQIARLVKLAPKSVGKLKNTLATQFHIADIVGTVLALEAKKVFSVNGARVIWSSDDFQH